MKFTAYKTAEFAIMKFEKIMAIEMNSLNMCDINVFLCPSYQVFYKLRCEDIGI